MKGDSHERRIGVVTVTQKLKKRLYEDIKLVNKKISSKISDHRKRK